MMTSNNPGNRVTATGLAILLLAVSAGVGSGDLGLLLGLLGVLAGANLIAVGISGPAAFARLGALTASLRRSLAFIGLMMASSAVTAVAGGEAGPMLCFAMFTLLLVGLCFINIRVLRDQ